MGAPTPYRSADAESLPPEGEDGTSAKPASSSSSPKGVSALANLIEQRVAAARRGENPYVIAKLTSGWLCIGDTQPLRGYCVLLADPIVPSLNALTEAERTRYSLDAIRAGDALLAVTGAIRINYETLANAEPSLHTHIIPRYSDEPEDKRRMPPMLAYDWAASRAFDEQQDGELVVAMRSWLS